MSVRLNLLLAVTTMTGCAGGSEVNSGTGADTGPSTSGAESTAGNTEPVIETTGISATSGLSTSSSTSDGPASSDGSTTTGSDDESTTGASTGEGATTDTGDTDSATDTDTDAETETDSDTGNCDLITPDNTCEGGMMLTAVSGDDGSQVSASGSGSTWFLVQVQETNASIFEEDLSYTVQLESSSVDYDVYVYQGPQDGDPDCDAVPVQGVGMDGLETVSADWDDDQGLGGEDDSLWLAIEIVHVTGSDCAEEWTLTVTGGT